MISNGDEDLASKMPAFLSSVKLIFEMYSCGTILGKELCELENSRESTMSTAMSVRDPVKSLTKKD